MSLDNLVGMSLEQIEPDKQAIARLMRAAERNIADSHVEVVSHGNRFVAACKAIIQLENLALQAKGYRTLTSKPGHPRPCCSHRCKPSISTVKRWSCLMPCVSSVMLPIIPAM